MLVLFHGGKVKCRRGYLVEHLGYESIDELLYQRNRVDVGCKHVPSKTGAKLEKWKIPLK